MTWRVVAAADLRRERWRNGLGWTCEIARGRVPGGAATTADADAWDWRLSLADIDRDCPFSVFPGIDRILVLTQGAGMHLRFADGESAAVTPERPQVAFAGERELACELLAGATRDFNVMWRRGSLHAQVLAQSLTEALPLTVAPATISVVHVLSGHARLTAPTGDIGLTAGDSLIVTASNDALALTGTAHLLRVVFIGTQAAKSG